jgi:excisionase family DNA binding protein
MFRERWDMADHGIGTGKMLLTVPETAEMLGVSEWLVWKLVWSCELKSTRVGRLVRLYLRDVQAYLEGNRRRVDG